MQRRPPWTTCGASTPTPSARSWTTTTGASKPALAGAGLEPCAVAYLDGSLWLHHSSDGDQEQGVLTLIAPCTCGNGYVDTALDGEQDLLQVLNDLRATGGRFPHDSGWPDCDSQRRLRAWGDARP